MRASKLKKTQSGQSMLEFAILVPLVISMMALLVETQIAISASIVAQKYVRQHLHFLFFNHRDYPERKFLPGKKGDIRDRFWVGLDNTINDNPTETNLQPVAPKFRIGRKKVPNDDDKFAETRQNMRLFTSAFICTPTQGFKAGEFFSENKLGETTFLGGSFPGYCSK